jgi:pyruvate/2-oxoglutarate dehydrogenase complex dihydrolipoamide acyltransferase (E2) component
MPFAEIALKIIFSSLAVLLVTSFSFLLILISNRLLRVRADRKHNIHIENRGNCRSIYSLGVSSEDPGLRFSLFVKDVPLVKIQTPQPDAQEQAAPAQESPQADSPTPAPAKPASASSAAPSVNTGTAVKSGQKAAAKAGTIASLLGAIGQLLPGSLGAGLRAQSARARDVQTNTSRAVQAPQTMQNQVGAVSKESGKLVGAKPANSSLPAQSTHSRPLTQTTAIATSPGASASARPAQARPASAYLVQTPELAPAQAFDLTLKIGAAKKRYPAGSFAYIIESQQFALDFPEANSAPVRRQGVVHFEKIGIWRYWIPAFTNLLVLLAGSAALILVIIRIWQFSFSGVLYG